MKLLRKKRFFALLLIFFVLFLFLNTDWIGRLMYPIEYRSEIKHYSQKHILDPYLVAAIIRAESNFQPDKVSQKGAVGLMQVMPDTANWVIRTSGLTQFSVEQLNEPQVNMEIGTWYLKYLFQQFHSVLINRSNKSQMAIIAASYNAGPGNVDKWLKSNRWDGDDSTIEQIPFGETRHYVQRIIYYYDKYQRFYEEL